LEFLRHDRTKSAKRVFTPGSRPSTLLLQRRFKDVDARHKAGHDELNQLSQHSHCDTGILVKLP
jgi:hypothetical protein